MSGQQRTDQKRKPPERAQRAGGRHVAKVAHCLAEDSGRGVGGNHAFLNLVVCV